MLVIFACQNFLLLLNASVRFRACNIFFYFYTLKTLGMTILDGLQSAHLIILCCRWYTMVHADGSVLQTFEYLKQHGLQGLKDILPAPSPIAWKLIACFGAFEAILQLALPGKRVEGPISPNGNIPVYKVCLGIIYLKNHISTCNVLCIYPCSCQKNIH